MHYELQLEDGGTGTSIYLVHFPYKTHDHSVAILAKDRLLERLNNFLHDQETLVLF